MASIKRRPDGQWRARYRDGDGKEHARHFPRKIDAQQWLNEVTASVVTGTYVDPRAGRVTFEDFHREWSQRQIWTHGSHRAVQQAVDSTGFKNTELRNIRRSHLEQWVRDMTTAGLAPTTIKTRMLNVRTIMRGAVRDRMLTADPGEGVVIPRQRRAEHAMTIPTPDGVQGIYDAAPSHLQPIIGLCAFAGLRMGEVVAVQLGDIDFLRRTLSVQRQAQRPVGHPLEIRAPKYGSERVVSLPDSLLQILSEHVKNQGVQGAEQWLFPKPDGGPAHQNTVNRWWNDATKAGGLPDVKLHDLRHFFASGLIAAGCDVVTVQRALGHSSASTTLDTYSHLWPTAEDKTRAAAQNLMAETFHAVPADSLRTGNELPASD